MLLIQLLVFYGTVISVTSDRACDVCNCSGTVVNCTGRSLTEIPTDIPENTTKLFLNGSQIRDIPQTAFLSLVNLQWLWLHDNQITEIPQRAFSSLVNLEELPPDSNSQ
ncbi:slit homolog 2 protein-like isoform X2 [Ostrea edulis]|uniref:slit homolog 2 protein-like isoform X2 n=1 Tax=Ostrea edulis TaxID=37623 RepID=UPI0024AF12E1|nr:slit homolog 2 protein-like isoform X2 [Ostrea edulis]